MKCLAIPLLLAVLAPVSVIAAPEPQRPPDAVPPSAATGEEDALARLLAEALALIKLRRQPAAIERLDQIIGWYQARHAGEKRRIYCARSQAEVLAYLAASAPSKDGAIALNAIWADAVFAKGFALVDLGRREEARAFFFRALLMSPLNSQYLAEAAELSKTDKDWPRAYRLFTRAAEVVDYAPERDRKALLGRAWRGMGFALGEMGKLDEAEALYRKCLNLDPKDPIARHELEYLHKRREAAKGGPAI